MSRGGRALEERRDPQKVLVHGLGELSLASERCPSTPFYATLIRMRQRLSTSFHKRASPLATSHLENEDATSRAGLSTSDGNAPAVRRLSKVSGDVKMGYALYSHRTTPAAHGWTLHAPGARGSVGLRRASHVSKSDALARYSGSSKTSRCSRVSQTSCNSHCVPQATGTVLGPTCGSSSHSGKSAPSNKSSTSPPSPPQQPPYELPKCHAGVEPLELPSPMTVAVRVEPEPCAGLGGVETWRAHDARSRPSSPIASDSAPPLPSPLLLPSAPPHAPPPPRPPPVVELRAVLTALSIRTRVCCVEGRIRVETQFSCACDGHSCERDDPREDVAWKRRPVEVARDAMWAVVTSGCRYGSLSACPSLGSTSCASCASPCEARPQRVVGIDISEGVEAGRVLRSVLPDGLHQTTVTHDILWSDGLCWGGDASYRPDVDGPIFLNAVDMCTSPTPLDNAFDMRTIVTTIYRAHSLLTAQALMTIDPACQPVASCIEVDQENGVACAGQITVAKIVVKQSVVSGV